jgi:hypothetical protein
MRRIVCTYRYYDERNERSVGLSRAHETAIPRISEKVLRIYVLQDDGSLTPYKGKAELGDSYTGTPIGRIDVVDGVPAEERE